jgi:hypothetical protein
MTLKLCESCGKFEVQWKLKDQIGDNKTYNVCTNCLQGLMLYDLSPVEYKNLLKNGHKATEFLLHDDFYDEDGRALQPVV